jgi:hypothetical protein
MHDGYYIIVKRLYQPKRSVLYVLCLAAVVYVANLWVITVNYIVNSDEIAQQVITHTLALTKHSVVDLPNDNFIAKIPFYSLMNHLPAKLALSIEFNLFSVVAMILYVLSFGYFVRQWRINKVVSYLPVVWLCSLGVLAALLSNPNSRNVEIGFAFLSLVFLHKLYHRTIHRLSDVWPLLSFALIVGLLFANDPYFLFVLGVPIIAVFGLRWLVNGHQDEAMMVALVGAAIAARALWVFLISLLGVHLQINSVVIATPQQALTNIGLIWQVLPKLFSAGFFGLQVDFSNLGLLLNTGLALVLLAGPFLLLNKSIRSDPWKTMFCLLPAFLIVIIVLSTIPLDTSSIRYLVLLPFYLAIELALIVNLLNRRLVVTLGSILIVATLFNIHALGVAYRGRPRVDPNQANLKLISLVESQGLSKGYANYWNGPVNTYLSNDKVLFIQTGCVPSVGVKLYSVLVD